VAKPLRETLIAESQSAGGEKITLTLFVLVTLFLLMACGSVGHLLLSRTTLRIREFTIKTMLGASLFRLVRQIIAETGLIVLIGSAFGLFLATSCSQFLVLILPGTLREELYGGQIHFDWRIIAYTTASALVISLLCSSLPVYQLRKSEAVQGKFGDRNSTIGKSQRSRLAFFVIVETALGFALFAAANGMIAYFNQLTHPTLGFRPGSLLTFQTSLTNPKYQDPAKRIQLVQESIRGLEQLPGVSSAAVTTTNPLSYGTWGAAVHPEGSLADAGSIVTVNHRLVSPGLFETMGISMKRGRAIKSTDTDGSPPVAVISSKMARHLFGQADPIGKRIEWVRRGRPIVTVIGVADDVRDSGQMQETWYIPYYQHPDGMDALTVHFMLHTSVSPEGIVHSVQQRMASIDPNLALYEIQSMSTLYDKTTAGDRIGSFAAICFAVLGLALIAMGTYGVVSFMVNASMREIAIRLALGAPLRHIRMTIISRGLAYVSAGIVVGVFLTEWESKLAAHLIPALRFSTPFNYTIGTVVLLAIGLAACYYPAQMAITSDPLEVLRAE
jgi:predicted permease